MREVQGDLWDFHAIGHWVGITTNGTVRRDKCCVMGRGVASQAKARFPELPRWIGEDILKSGNIPFAYSEFRVVTFPVKHHWRDKADIGLVRESASYIAEVMWDRGRVDWELFLVRPGCGNGGLQWEEVKPIIEPYFDERVFIVDRNFGEHYVDPLVAGDVRAH